MTYKVVALARLVCPRPTSRPPPRSPPSTARRGRELGLRRGRQRRHAQPHPRKYRALYEIYPAKACIRDRRPGRAGASARIEGPGRGRRDEGPGVEDGGTSLLLRRPPLDISVAFAYRCGLEAFDGMTHTTDTLPIELLVVAPRVGCARARAWLPRRYFAAVTWPTGNGGPFSLPGSAAPGPEAENGAAHLAGTRLGAEPPRSLKIPADLTTPVRAFLCLTQPGEDAFLLESVAGGEAQARYSFLGFDPGSVFEAGSAARVRRNGNSRPLDGTPTEAFASWLDLASPRPGAPRPSHSWAAPWGGWTSPLSPTPSPSLATSFPGARDRRGWSSASSPRASCSTTSGRRHGSTASPVPGETASRGPSVLLEAAGTPGRSRRRVGGGRARVGAVESGPERDRFSRNLAAIQEAILAGDAYQVVLSEPFARDASTGTPSRSTAACGASTLRPTTSTSPSAGGRSWAPRPRCSSAWRADRSPPCPSRGRAAAGATAAGGPPPGGGPPRAIPRSWPSTPCSWTSRGTTWARLRLRFRPGPRARGRGALLPRHAPDLRGAGPASPRTGRPWRPSGAPSPRGPSAAPPRSAPSSSSASWRAQDRGVYGGAVGTVDAAGNLETCIAIRTMEFEGGKARSASGAGIVADSAEEAEWDEIHHKAGIMLAALGGECSEMAKQCGRVEGGSQNVECERDVSISPLSPCSDSHSDFPLRRCGASHDSLRGQLRLLHLQPRLHDGRAGARPAGRAQRRDHAWTTSAP